MRRKVKGRLAGWLLLMGMGAGALGWAGAQCRFEGGGKVRVVRYRFTPEVTADGLVMHVGLGFRASGGEGDVLVVPMAWAGEPLHGVSGLRVVSGNGTIAEGPDAESRTVRAKAGRWVWVEYEVRKDWKGPLVHPLQFHAVVMPTYFEFTGSNALVRLKLADGETERAEFDWQGMAAGWALATSFGASESGAGRCQTFTGPWQSVEDGLYAGGDFRIRRFAIGGKPAVLAVRGQWIFTDEEAEAQIAKVVGTVRDFWHDNDFPYFLVTLKPYDQEHGSSDGSAFTNAFWMYVSNKDSLGGLLPQLAHESFHAWDPMKMGRQPAGVDDVPIRWFREGPTDYYGHLLTYRAGEATAQSYVDFLNGDLRRFPVSDDEYVRGTVISLWLDGTIRRESGGKRSLDDVMFDMVKEGAQPYTLARILATAERYLSPTSREEFEMAVKAHGELEAPEKLPGVDICAQRVSREMATFDVGLDTAHSWATRVVTGVREGGPAYVAGLRDGETLLAISVSNGQPEKLAKFKVKTAAGDTWVTFYPRGKTVTAWQYELKPGQQCTQAP